MPLDIQGEHLCGDARKRGSGVIHELEMRKLLKVRYESIITAENLLLVWKKFQRGKKQRRDVSYFQLRLVDHLLALERDLLEKRYVHGLYYAFVVSDPKPRSIHKATVRDRIVHHLLYQTLYEYFDERFIYDSYSCRVGKGTHRAILRFTKFGRIVSKNHTRTCWVLKCDIKKFFAHIDHTILKRILSEHIDSKDTLWLLDRVIDSFSTEGKPGVGLPLGNLTSQLLVNIYMNEFDQFMKHKLKAQYYIRYSDDFVVLSHKRNHLLEILPHIEIFLRDQLKLALHPDKVSISTLASDINFLGWVHFHDHRVLRTSTKRRMFKALNGNPEEATLMSYRGMLSHGNAHKLSKLIPDVIKNK